MRILSSNIGYLLDYTGGLSEYLLAPHRALVGDTAAEERATERLVDVVAAEEPDVVCLTEIDQGSIRTTTEDQIQQVADHLDERGLSYRTRVETKYGDTNPLSRLPMLRHLSNGMLVRESLETRTIAHFLETGTKRLVIETQVGDLSVLLTHLSMGSRSRRRQLRELADLIGRRDEVVLCGDFNVYQGLGELDEFTRTTGLDLQVPGETVPRRPFDSLVTETRALDLFLTSPSIDIDRCTVLDVQVSDHRPVVLDVA
jgi:endonuclease/exonuclease/phosphatase family metal-dependent hydrolase